VKLSRRETQVVYLLAKGKKRPEISRLMGIESCTVQSYIDRVCVKFDVSSRLEAVVYAIKKGFIST
jgi:DNA-binding NarL/FixJ family response regulator